MWIAADVRESRTLEIGFLFLSKKCMSFLDFNALRATDSRCHLKKSLLTASIYPTVLTLSVSLQECSLKKLELFGLPVCPRTIKEAECVRWDYPN
jgi:hypothetical protein